MSIWVPPALSDRGYTERQIEVLVDLARLPEERKLPPPGSSVVYDDAYSWMYTMGLTYRVGEGFSSVVVLSKEGIALFNEYTRLVAGFATMMRGSAHKDAMGQTGQRFHSWDDVLNHVRTGKPISYQAPMDTRPRSVVATSRGNGRKVRVDPLSRDADAFWADESHLDRFRNPKGVTVKELMADTTGDRRPIGSRTR